MSTLEFNHQVVNCKNPLEYFAFTLTHDREEAADLLQDTLLKAFLYRDKFTDSSNLKAWLYTIMKNTFINNFRKKKRVSLLADQKPDIQIRPSVSGSDWNPVLSGINYRDVEKLVQDLPEDLGRPFMLFVEGYRYKEIAEICSLPIGTVKSRIFLARKALMKAVSVYH